MLTGQNDCSYSLCRNPNARFLASPRSVAGTEPACNESRQAVHRTGERRYGAINGDRTNARGAAPVRSLTAPILEPEKRVGRSGSSQEYPQSGRCPLLAELPR